MKNEKKKTKKRADMRRTYALGEIGTIEKAALGKLIKITLNFIPCVDAVCFTTVTYEPQSTKSLLGAGPGPVQLSTLLSQSSSR